jgi:lactate permease
VICLLVVRLSALKASIVSFVVTLIIFTFQFQAGVYGTLITIAKGCSLALFVILIVWGAMLLYNLVNETKALNVINRNIEIAVDKKFHQFVLLSWAFTPFLQGIAGFGVPVIVVTSILISLGFKPVESACAVLIGHSWGISFGSMGSSIFAIDMVTRSSIYEILVYMARFGVIGILGTGIGVCFIYGGMRYVLKGLPFVLFVTLVMGMSLNLLAHIGMISVIGLLTALSGLTAGFIFSGLRRKEKVKLYRAELNLFQAMLPYIITVFLSILFFILDPTYSISFSFPSYETLLGQVVPYEINYVTFNILRFPFTLIAISTCISVIVYYKKKTFNLAVAKEIAVKTVKKCMPITAMMLLLLSMAVMMIDSGMIERIAVALASVTGDKYPAIAPFIGLVGAFVTGSNTNSNIIFGSLQEIAAGAISMSPVIMCAAQSIGASVGTALGPTNVALAASTAGIQNNESKLYLKIILPILVINTLIGIANFIIITM